MEVYFGNMEEAQGAIARQRVLTDFKALVRSSEHLLKATAGDVNGTVKDARDRVTAALSRSKVACEHLQEEAVAAAQAAAQHADKTVRAHPYESIGVAFGVGLLIGILVSRK
jgi:ElaB/YqjD/DUF883 family membrane-anchored ribosome-binding protein